MKLTEEIINSIDKKKHSFGVFIDLNKALDTINYNILLKRNGKVWN